MEMERIPGRNSVTSYALPWIITQHDSLLLCFSTSLPLSFFMLAVVACAAAAAGSRAIEWWG